MNIRSIKGIIVASVALFFTLFVFNDLTDFASNQNYIASVMSLETVKNETIAWRAVRHPNIQLLVYWVFILLELTAALFCWIGTLQIFKYSNASREKFSSIKILALTGLTLGFLKYMVGFVDFGSEWFYLWQSDLKDGQVKAILFSILLLTCMIFVSSNSNEELNQH